jgi:hypothetical protein
MTRSVLIQAIAVSTGLMLGLAGCAQSAVCSTDYEAQLDRQIAITFTAVREAKSATFLNSVGDEGLTLNGRHVGRAELEQAFQNRNGVYCNLFACNGQPGALKSAFSVRGTPQKQYDANNRVALVLSAANTNDEVMLTFKYAQTRCAWDLIDITTP